MQGYNLRPELLETSDANLTLTPIDIVGHSAKYNKVPCAVFGSLEPPVGITHLSRPASLHPRVPTHHTQLRAFS